MTADHPLVAWLRDVHTQALRDADDIHDVESCGRVSRWGSGIGPCDCEWGSKGVTARVEAERGLLALHVPTEEGALDEDGDLYLVFFCARCWLGESCTCCADEEDRSWPCPVWAHIAMGWSNWPGYDEAWRPA